MLEILYSREFSMPNKQTFSLPPVVRLLSRRLEGASVIVDPFAGNSTVATLTNDLNPETSAQSHMLADAWLDELIERRITVDAVLFDPPYKPAPDFRVLQGRWIGSWDEGNSEQPILQICKGSTGPASARWRDRYLLRVELNGVRA